MVRRRSFRPPDRDTDPVFILYAIPIGLVLGFEAVAGMLMVGTIAGVLLATVLNNGGGAVSFFCS